MSQQAQLADLFAAEFLAGKSYASIVKARSQTAIPRSTVIRAICSREMVVTISTLLDILEEADHLVFKERGVIWVWLDISSLHKPKALIKANSSIVARSHR